MSGARITSYNVCYTKLLRKGNELLGVDAAFQGRDAPPVEIENAVHPLALGRVDEAPIEEKVLPGEVKVCGPLVRVGDAREDVDFTVSQPL